MGKQKGKSYYFYHEDKGTFPGWVFKPWKRELVPPQEAPTPRHHPVPRPRAGDGMAVWLRRVREARFLGDRTWGSKASRRTGP